MICTPDCIGDLVQHLLEVAREQQEGAKQPEGEHRHRHVGLRDRSVLEQAHVYERMFCAVPRMCDECRDQRQAGDRRYQHVPIGHRSTGGAR